MERAHTHDEVELNLSLDAPALYLFCGRPQSVPRRRLSLFWANAPHQLTQIEPHARMIWLTVPLRTFLSWPLTAALVTRLLSNEIVVDADTIPRADTVPCRHRPLGFTRFLPEPVSGQAVKVHIIGWVATIP